jgi:hypothetical protein
MNVTHRWSDRDVKRLLKAPRDADLFAQAIELDTQGGIVRIITAGDQQVAPTGTVSIQAQPP